MTDRARCAYGGCEKPVPDHVVAKGGRFCSASCRQADHRERGKSIPAQVDGASRYSNGDVCLVVRVSSAFYARLHAYAPGLAIDLLERE
jgi:hypothetical protein